MRALEINQTKVKIFHGANKCFIDINQRIFAILLCVDLPTIRE